MSDIKGNNKQIFDFLSSKGASGIGNNADEFQKFMEKDSNRRQVYDYLSSVKATGLGNSYEEFSSFVYDGGQQQGKPQPVDNSKWAVTPSPYWTGSAKQEQQATAPAEPAPAPTPEPKQAPAPKQQTQEQVIQPVSSSLEGKSREDLLEVKAEYQPDIDFANEYEARKKKVADMEAAFRASRAPRGTMPPNLSEDKQWLEDNKDKYAAAKERADEFNFALGGKNATYYGERIEELDKKEKDFQSRIEGSGRNEIKAGPGGFVSYPKDITQMPEDANYFAASQMLDMAKQQYRQGNKYDAGYQGDNLEKLWTAVSQFVGGAANNIDMGSFTFGLTEGSALKAARDAGDKYNDVINSALKGMKMSNGDINAVLSSIESNGSKLQAMEDELNAASAEIDTMSDTYEDMVRRGDPDAEAYGRNLQKKIDAYNKRINNEYKPAWDAYKRDSEAYKEVMSTIDAAVATGLTEGERAVLDAFDEFTRAKMERANDTSIAAKAGAGAEQSAEFMLDFILTGGISKAGTKVATKIATNRALKRLGADALKEMARVGKTVKPGLGLRLGTDVVTSLARTGVMFPRTIQAYSENLTEYSGKDEAGRYNFDRSQANALGNALLTQFIEYWSEGFGEYFGEAEQALFRGITKNAPKTAIGQTLKGYRGSIGQYLDKGKFDGMFNEMLEEVVGSTFNALAGWMSGDRVGDAGAMKEFFSGENLATLALSFLPMSAIGAATNVSAYHKMKERYDNGVAGLSKYFETGAVSPEELQQLSKDMPNLSPEEIKDKIVDITDRARKANGGKLPSDFTQNVLGYLEGEFAMGLRYDEWEDSQEKMSVVNAYTASYTNPDARAAWDLNDYEQTARQAAMEAGFTEDELDNDSYMLAQEAFEIKGTQPERSDVLMNYASAKAAAEGLRRGYAEQTQQVSEIFDERVRKNLDTNGAVTTATITLDGKPRTVFITQEDAGVDTTNGTLTTPTGPEGVVRYRLNEMDKERTAPASQFSNAQRTDTTQFIDEWQNNFQQKRNAYYEQAQNTVSPTGQAREISEKVGQSIVVSDGNGVYQPFKVERMTNGGNSVVLSGDKKALQGIAEAMGMRVPTSGYLEAPVTRLYPLLEKEENGSLSTGPGEETQEEAPAAPAQEAAPAAEQTAGLGDLRDQTVPISVNGQVQNAHVIDMSDGNVMYEELDGNGDVVRTARLTEDQFARAMQEAANPTPAAEAPAAETPAAAVEETPAPAIPVDEKTGEKMYAAPGVRVEDAIADLYATEGLTEADVDQYIAEEAAKAEAARNPERGNMSPQAWGQAKQEAARVADFWAAMQRAAQQRKAQQEEAIEEAVEEARPVETAEAPAEQPASESKRRIAPAETPMTFDSRRRVVARLKNWARRTGVKVNIIRSVDEVKDETARKALKEGRALTGWFNDKTGQVDIFLPNVMNAVEADKTFIHETVAHKGLRGLLGEEGYDALCDRVWNELMTPEEQEEFMEYNRHLQGSDEYLRRAAADEYIARLSENMDMQDNRNIFERIVDWIMDLLGLGGNVSGIEEGAAEKATGEGSITRSDLYDLLEDSLKRFEKGRKKVSDVLQGENGDVRFSEATYMPFKDEFGNEHEGTRQQLFNYMVGQGFPQKQIDDFVQHMDYWYDFTQNIANLVNPDGSFRYQAFHEWSETIPEYKMYEGKIVKAISTLVTNGEYPLNFELSTDCIKREAFTQIINEMLKMDASFWQKLTPANIIEVQNLEKAFGIEVACPLCFVEAKRLNILSWATSVADKWNTALNAIAPGVEHTPFEFYKDGDLTVDQVGRKNGEVLITQRMKQEIDAINSFLGDAKNLRDKDAKRLRENAKEMEKLLNGWIEAYGAEHGGDITGFTLTKKQEAQLEKIRNRNLKSTTGRMMRIIAAHPEVRHSLSPMDLLGSMGLMRIQRMRGEGFAEMLSAIVSANGTGTPKIVQSAVPYDGEIIDVPQARFEKAAGIGGARLFSFSDADLTKIFDIMQIMWDCAARQAKVQSYSKEVPYIVLFGTSGVKINMSMLPEARPGEDIERQYRAATKAGKQRIKHDVEENVGLQLDQEGNIVGLDLSDSHSISDEFARWIFHNPEYNANCGAVMVGIGVNHSIYCMMQPHIRMLIPFHLSGMPLAAREKGDVFWYHDFTNEQNTGVMVNGLRVKLMGKDGSIVPSVKEDFNIYEGEEKADWDIRERCRAYVKWCDENGLLPKFPWAVNAEGYANWMREHGYEPRQDFIDAMNAHTTDGVWDEYYKVITDFTAYQPEFDAEGNMIGEKSARHLPVTGRFNTDPKLLQAVFGTNTEGTEVTSEDSMLNNRERSIENTDKHAREIAALAINMLNNGKKASDMVDMSGSQFNNKADSELFLQERELPAPEDVKALEREVQPEASADPQVSEAGGTMFRERTAPAPQKTQKVYKLMRLGEDGNLYPLFIDRDAQPIKLGTWYDADSPDMEFLKKMPSGVFLVDAQNGTYTSLEDYKKERGEKVTKLPGIADVEEAARNGLRWMKITDTENAQRRYEGENRKYENIGINGSEGVSTFAMRPGWHAGSLPTMRQIGKGSEKNLRDDNFVWVEGEIAADKDYNEEAQRNPDKDIPTHIPTDGFYMKATNANKKASQADRVGWYVAGAFKPNRIMSDSEARQVIDDWNAEHPDAPVEYDFPRESGKVFNAETMQLEELDPAHMRAGTPEYDELIKKATERINNRIDQLLEQKRSSRSQKENTADLNPEGDYSPANAGAPSTASSAKVNKKIKPASELADKIVDFIDNLSSDPGITAENFAEELVSVLKLGKQNQPSKYINVSSPKGDTVTLRVADHRGNARNIILKGVKTDRGVSLVLRDKNSSEVSFSPNNWADVVEYVYNNPNHDKLVDIAKSIFGLLDEGYYFDLAKADERNLSPRGQTLFREANRNQLGFVSNADAALDRIKMDKATPEQWVKMLEKEGGLKAGEDKWLGLSDWLKSQDRKSITKDEIADYIDEHRIQIEEVNYRDMDDFDPVTEAGSGLDSEFDDLGATDAAFEQMQEKYPGLKDIMQIWRGGRAGNHLVLRDEVDEDTIERYMERWGILENPIQSIRLEYTTEGLDNKREIALTVPTIEPWNQSDKIHFGDAGNGRAVAWIRFGDTLAANEGVEAAKERHREAARALGEYRDELQEKYADSDQPYYEACTPEELSKLKSLKEEEHRLYEEWDNLNATPRRVLVIDEIQSKRHQEGREHGYAAANVEALEQKWRDASKAYDDFIDSLKEKYGGYEGMLGHITEEENQRAIELNDASIDAANAVDRAKGGIPAAPFEKNWHELAMKRMLRLAAEEGYDAVAWTTGGQQAERYNIGGKVDWIQRGNDFGQFPESVFIKMGDKVNSVEVDENGTIVDSTHALSDTVGKPLSDLLGKELANKIMSAETGPNGRLEGEGLRVGGEGMKGFYDDILPRFMNKYGKKWGVKVSDITLPNVEKSGEIMHSVPVTQEMKESVMQGQTMFREASVVDIKSKDSTESRDDVINKIPAGGALYPNDDQQRDIRVTRTALRHSLPHPDEARIKAAANIDRVIKNAVKLGDLPVDPDEIGKTDNVSVFYCPVRIDDKLYSARLVVKKYIDQKGDVLDEMAMYDMNLHKRKADSSVSSVAGKPGTYIDESASAYKVKDLIFNTQEADKKIAGVTETFFRERITPEQDKEYMDAVNAGDMEKAQRMVDEAARAAGYTIHAYHGTDSEDGEMPFTVFESGHFTDDYGFASYYNDEYVYDVYIKMDNPLEYDFKGQNSDWALDENGNRITTHRVFNRAIEEGYDGVILTNVDEYGDGIEEEDGEYPSSVTDYIPATPNQIKSADPVTYDDNGNVIPLSERFNPENNDIRFREARPVDARSAQAGYEEEIQKKTTQFLLEWQDQDIPVRIAINKVMNEVGMTDLPEDCDYLTRHNLVSSRADAQMHNYKLFYFEPMMQTIGQIEDILAGGKPGFFENLFGSRKQKRWDAYKKIVDYCYAVSALERNAWKRAEAQRLMEKALERLSEKWEQERAAINADSRLTAEEKAKAIERAQKRYQKESREIEDKYADRDYSGITALMGHSKEEWQEAEDEARAMIADFQRSVNNNDLINEMWDRIRACTDFNLEHAYKFGLLSRAEYERLHGTESQPRMWEYYLPLRGFKERTAEDEYNYTMFTSDMAGGAVVTEAKGRVTEADDPFATMRHISELEIVQGLQNWAKQSLYNFVLRAGENSLLTQVEPWYVKEPGPDNWTVAEPNEGESLEEFEARMQEAYENGEARRGRNGLKLGHIMGNKMHRNQHMIRLKLNGAEKMIWVNGNPVLAQSVNGVPGWNNWYTKNVNKVNRALSQFYTTYSLKFITKNKLRDTQFSRIAALVDEPQAYLTQLEKNWWANNGYVAFGYPMMKLVAEWESGELEKKPNRTEREQMFIDFMYDGGATGYSMINSMDKIKRELEKMVKNAGHGESPLNPIRWYAMGVGALNEASELLTRFTFYQTSRMMGRSRERSAYDAKESSVNFNRRGLRSGKGAAGWTAAFASTLYLFINPAIQGLDKFVRLHKSHPWKMGLVDATYFMMGFVNSLLNAMVAGASDGGDGDDEEKMGPDWYWNIPEWVRRSNMIIGSPFKKLGKWGYLVIALPIEYKGFYAMGELVSSIVQRKYAAKDAPTLANEVVGVVSELLPINPVEGYTPGDNAAMSVLRNMAPDIIAPIVDVATNRSFAGIPLWKENIYDEAQPLSQSAFASTPEILNKAVIKLSEVTSTMPWHIDIPSGAVRGLLKGYGGGGYTFVEDVSKLIFADAAHPRHWDNVPFVGGFTGYLEEDRRNSYNNNMLQRYKELSDDVVKRVRSAAPGEDLKAADIYNKPESLPQNARVTLLLNSDKYILGKMYYNGMLKAGDDVKRLRTAWNKAKKAYLDIADDKDVSDEAKDAAEKKVMEAWLDFTTAEDGLVNSLLEEEYDHARKKIANGVPYEKKETLSEKAYKLTNRK